MSEWPWEHPAPDEKLDLRILRGIEQILSILSQQPAPATAGSLSIALGPIVSQAPAPQGAQLMSITLKDSEKTIAHVSGSDAAGQPTSGVVAFTVDNAAIAAIVDNGDGSCAISSAGLGTAKLGYTDTDADGNVISGETDIIVVAGDTATLAATFDTPTAK